MIEDHLQEIAVANEFHPFDIGEPLYMKSIEGYRRDPTTYIAMGFSKSGWGRWWAEVCPSDDLGTQYSMPVEWLTNIEPRSDYRRINPNVTRTGIELAIIEGGRLD